jgi:hypothetical protein
MKPLLALAVASALFAAPAAHAGDPAIDALIHQMINSFNKGDLKAVKATHVASPLIVDEVPPFAWSGPTAFDEAMDLLNQARAARGEMDGVMGIGTPIQESIYGDHAYVVMPSSYTYRQKGQTMREEGTITFVLVKVESAWKIQAWTWASPEAKPVK